MLRFYDHIATAHNQWLTMSDSLREQMLKAGFKETPGKKKKETHSKSKKKNTKPPRTNQNELVQKSGPSSLERANIAKREAVAERKRIKAQIKAIIEAAKIEQTTGESVYSYLVGKRIKQMFVSESIQKQLVDGVLVITRLNGSTYLIPAETGEQVLALNPDWVVIVPADETTTDGNDDYADYQVPDDLKW